MKLNNKIVLAGLTVFFTLLNGGILQSQNILLHEQPPKDTVHTNFGPNKKHYAHFYSSLGAILAEPSDKGANIYDNSIYLDFGYKYKYKIFNFSAIGASLSYNLKSFNLLQDSTKTIPDSVLHDKEKLIAQNLEFCLYKRINYTKRGNTIGKYIDLGAYIDWVFMLQHTTKDKIDGKIYKSRITGMDYYEPFVYGFYAQLGFGRFSIFGKYRYSDMFKENLIELPRVIAGIQLSFAR